MIERNDRDFFSKTYFNDYVVWVMYPYFNTWAVSKDTLCYCRNFHKL